MILDLPNEPAILVLEFLGLARARGLYASNPLFPFSDFWLLYLLLVAFLIILLALDLKGVPLRPQTTLVGEAMLWMGVFGTLALVLILLL